MAKELKRWMQEDVKHALKVRRVVLIGGARQCGKSTLMRSSLKPGERYVSMDNSRTMQVAQDSPDTFVQHAKGTMGIDEIQKLPRLISDIKMVVDLNPRKGQYLISGSSDIRMMAEIKESLAGRLRRLPLRTLAEGEIRKRKRTFLKRAFEGDFPDVLEGGEKQEVLRLALRGGYPEVLQLSPTDRTGWFRDYTRTLLTHDLRDISNIRHMEAMENLLRAFAAWSSKYMDIMGVSAKLEIARSTFNAYAGALTGLYIHETLPAWTESDYDRIGRRPKSFITDSGLMAGLLRWDEKMLSEDPDRAGKLVETFVFHELSAHIGAGDDYDMWHYRDRAGREIDFIIRERNTGNLLLIDAKAGTSAGPDDFRHMRWFKENLAPKGVSVRGIVLYSGKNLYRLRDGFLLLPTSALWA